MNAHQRRIARRAVPAAEPWDPGVDWLDCLPLFDEQDSDDDDLEPGTCPVCRGDGGDPMDDYLLPCGYCMGEGREC